MNNGEYINYLRDESFIKLGFDISMDYITDNEENKKIIIIIKNIIMLSVFVLIIMLFYFSKNKQIIELTKEIKKIDHYHKICHYGILLMYFII